MIREKIKTLIKEKIGREAVLERPLYSQFGDYSTNLALKEKINPQKIVKKLSQSPLFDKVEAAGPGFINFHLSSEALKEELKVALRQKNDYGKLKAEKKEKIQVEFISANPTGPLTVGNGRGGPWGDVLAKVLEKAGHQVKKAYYVNDYGRQIELLGHSILGGKQSVYQGEYIKELAKKIISSRKKPADPYQVGQLAAQEILENSIKKTIARMKIKFDQWIFESCLYQSGQAEEMLAFLRKKGLICEKDGALWFKSSSLGDRRDRVVVRKDGTKTYLLGDLALHRLKFEKEKFDRAINVWGADHHGDVAALEAGVKTLGRDNKLETILLQFVTVLERGEKRKMSKRSGFYVTMDELLDQAGADAVRFFFLEKSVNTHLTFDIKLAQERSSKNPVYYVQYAYARACRVLEKARAKSLSPSFLTGKDFFKEKTEKELLRHLVKLPEIIEETACDYQLQRLPRYAFELAGLFHKFYEQCPVLSGEKKEVVQLRLALVSAAKQVLKNTLSLMGISAPKRM